MYNLEDHLKNATDSSAIQGVYSLPRISTALPWEITTLLHLHIRIKHRRSESGVNDGLDYFSEENDKDYVVYFATIGLARDGDDKITIHTNDNSDKQAIHEIAKDDNTSWYG